MNNGIGDRFGDHRLQIGDFIHGRIQLRHKGSDSHAGERFILRLSGKLQRHEIAVGLTHRATSNSERAVLSFS
ncbi:hypothetical protein D3C73_1521570 [compost metagenome]